MKLIASHKKSPNTIGEVDFANLLNSGFGTSFKAMPDSDVPKYIEDQALRGYVCFEFDHTGTYQTQTTVIKSQVA